MTPFAAFVLSHWLADYMHREELECGSCMPLPHCWQGWQTEDESLWWCQVTWACSRLVACYQQMRCWQLNRVSVVSWVTMTTSNFLGFSWSPLCRNQILAAAEHWANQCRACALLLAFRLTNAWIEPMPCSDQAACGIAHRASSAIGNCIWLSPTLQGSSPLYPRATIATVWLRKDYSIIYATLIEEPTFSEFAT